MWDVCAAHATRLLVKYGPYIPDVPCESEDDWGISITRVSDSEYVISHWALFRDIDVYLEASLLREDHFDLVGWYQDQVRDVFGSYRNAHVPHLPLGDALLSEVRVILEQEVPAPEGWKSPDGGTTRFECTRSHPNIRVDDLYLGVSLTVPISLLNRHRFDLPNYYATHVRKLVRHSVGTELGLEGGLDLPIGGVRYSTECTVELNSVGVSVPTSLSALQRTAASPRDFKRRVPEPVVVVVRVNDQPARTLLDTGSLSDFMSAKLAHQLGIKPFELEKPLPVHLAVQGSRAKINLGCNAGIEYQTIRETRYFDIINLLNYDLILGTPFLFQHQVFIGFNPAKVVVGSSEAQPLKGQSIRVLESRAADLFGDRLEEARRYLHEYAAPICKEAQDSPLPPLREINHTIPLKDARVSVLRIHP
ncbi:hypothetical protein OBBRIDRAFT_738693 [Obba rivulosa]|uniref:Uncharacterized protein n=1 Tax=Obba rivulosa TaxID=1052685 RepID=A0A8E2AMK9_9APHY|nr:hypothetical protein OBBRIDRAFT_738693 [Obba rivulosa]